MTLEEFGALGFDLKKILEVQTPSFEINGKVYAVANHYARGILDSLIEEVNSNRNYYAFYPSIDKDGFRIVKLDSLLPPSLKEKLFEYYKENI